MDPAAPRAAVFLAAAIVGAGLIAIATGPLVRAMIPGAGLHAFPFTGEWALAPAHHAVVGVAVATLAAVAYWSTATRARWRVVLWASAPAAATWAIALATVRGPQALRGSLESRFDYLAVVPVGSARTFVAGFVAGVPSFPTHVKSHPPGIPLLFDLLHRIGLRGSGWAAAACIAAGAAAAPAVLLAVGRLADEHMARKVAPFVVAAPFALWLATSADAIFAGVAAWGITAAVMAATSTRRSSALSWAVASGALFGLSLLLSYGLVIVVLVVGGVLVGARRFLTLAVVLAACASLVLAAGVLGFVWWDGLAATGDAYRAGIADARPYSVFVIANLAVVALATGPAWTAGLVRLRQPGLGALVGGALVAVALANVSGLSKGEVERIWLPFFPWLMIGAAGLDRPARWLAVQVGLTTALAIALRSPW